MKFSGFYCTTNIAYQVNYFCKKPARKDLQSS